MPLSIPLVLRQRRSYAVFPLGLLALAMLALNGPAEARPRTAADLPHLATTPSHQNRGAMTVFSAAAQDTTWYGGTFWAADSGRWEALQDSVWTFDTGVGSDLVGSSSNPDLNPYKQPGLHATMEGWTGWDVAYTAFTYFRRITATDPRWDGPVCVGSAAGLGGQASFWCGVFPEEAVDLCYADGQGYGNNWNICIGKAFNYTGGSVTLAWDMVVETEDNYDGLKVFIDSTTQSTTPARQVFFDFSGHDSITVAPGTLGLPMDPGPVSVRFCFLSDALYSDEDGLNATTCGAVALDSIELSGGITSGPDTFETGDDGWILQPAPPGPGGDWSNVVHVGDLPDPLAFCVCAVSDSVLLFEDTDAGGHGLFQDNLAVSPWIDLGSDGYNDLRPGKVLALDVYSDLPLLNFIFGRVMVQWYPDLCPTNGELRVSPWTSHNQVFQFSSFPYCTNPGGDPYLIELSHLIPPSATQVRIAVGVVSYCRFFANCTQVTNSSPWYDNIRLGVYGTAGAPLLSIEDEYLPQDTFPEDGALSPLSPGRIDCALRRPGPGSTRGVSLGDTLIVLAANDTEADMEVHVQFAIDPGPGIDSLGLANFLGSVTFSENRGGLDWYEARMDTAERGGTLLPGRWMTARIEGSPGFTGSDTDLDPFDPHRDGQVSRLANDIFPDHLFPMGTHLSLFYKARFVGGTAWFLLPDTTGGNYYTLEVLPSSYAEDQSFNCVLYVDGAQGSGGDRMPGALRTVLGAGGNNHDGDRFDTYAMPAAFHATFGRPLNGEYGATVLQSLAYRSILWNTGIKGSGPLLREDANVLMPFLTLADVGPRYLYLTGDNLARGIFATRSDDPEALTLLEEFAGVVFECPTFAAIDCPGGTVRDLTSCVDLDPVVGAPLAGTLGRSVDHVGKGSGCPELRSFDVIQPNPSPTHGIPERDETYQTPITTLGPPHAASVVNSAQIGGELRFRVVTDAVSVEHRRDAGGCLDETPIEERLTEVLDLFGHTGGGAELYCWHPIFGAVDEDPVTGFTTRLLALSPNPLRAGEVGRIRFSLERPGSVRLDLFDVQGRLVKVLFDGPADAGWTEVAWTGENGSGATVSSGVYFTRFRALGEDQTQRLVYLGR